MSKKSARDIETLASEAGMRMTEQRHQHRQSGEKTAQSVK